MIFRNFVLTSILILTPGALRAQAPPVQRGRAPAARQPATPPRAPVVAVAPSVPANARYVGSKACQSCHADIYARWQKTPMANIVRDPREHPEAILPDLTKADPLLTFKKEDVALV